MSDGWKHFNDRVRNKVEGEYGEFTNADWQAAVQMSERIAELEGQVASYRAADAKSSLRASEAEAFRSAVVGWRENDHPEWFDRRTAEYVADLGRDAEKQS